MAESISIEEYMEIQARYMAGSKEVAARFPGARQSADGRWVHPDAAAEVPDGNGLGHTAVDEPPYTVRVYPGTVESVAAVDSDGKETGEFVWRVTFSDEHVPSAEDVLAKIRETNPEMVAAATSAIAGKK